MSASLRRFRHLAADSGAATCMEYAAGVAVLVLAFILAVSAWSILAGRVSDLNNSIAQTGSGPIEILSLHSRNE